MLNMQRVIVLSIIILINMISAYVTLDKFVNDNGDGFFEFIFLFVVSMIGFVYIAIKL